ncbi:hypothetical protein FQN57_006174 [Myotisia sp. PD_48]|nr:hypothetical protein FQN57_006174 [Myotisia sp. PD_48]
MAAAKSILRGILPRANNSVSLCAHSRAIAVPRLIPSSSSSFLAQRARPSLSSPYLAYLSLSPSAVPTRCAYSTNTRAPNPLTDSKPATPEEEAQNKARRDQEPAYMIKFTCKPCSHRSSHRITKHGYHKGTVLITCPGCHNRHVISDHLKIFMDEPVTLEDLLARQGMKVTRGTIESGDVEWWEKPETDPTAESESESEPKSIGSGEDPQGKL